MPATSPDLLQRHFEWRNRLHDWRARAGENVFGALAWLAFVAFALVLADPHWNGALRSDAAWARPLPALAAGIALAIALLSGTHARRSALAREQRNDWLAAMPLAPADRRRARATVVARSAATSALLLLALLAWAALRASAPSSALLAALAGGVVLAALLAPWTPERAPGDEEPRRTRAVAVAVAPGTRGLALLGAALEPAVARLPTGAPWVAGAFILLPPSTPAIAVPALILLFTAASMAVDLVLHWRQRHLADQAWLAALPLHPARLFAAYVPTLLRRGTLLCLLVGGCLHLLGAPALFAWLLALALWLALVDAVLCAFATRLAPPRYPLLCMLHTATLFAALQVLPPALPLVYAACAWQAWRRGLR